MKPKLRPVIMLLAVAFFGPVAEWLVLRRPIEPWSQYIIIEVALSAFAIYWWYWLDKRDRGFRAGALQNIGVAVFGLIGLPVYLLRSRGWAKGAVATLIALAIWLLSGAFGILGEAVGRRIAF